MNTVDVIDNAIKYIETNGWCQNELFSDAGQACIRGALYFGAGSQFKIITLPDGATMSAMDDKFLDSHALRDADDIVVSYLRDEDYPDIPEFNDADGTSQEDVILLLKRVREIASADLRN